MPTDFRPNRGAFVSALDWIDRFGQVPMNVAQGRFGAAGRHALDILGEAADAPFPGDWISEATGPEDWTTGAELLGVDSRDSPAGALAANVGLGTALNPLTYTGFGFLARGARAGASAVGAGARSLPAVGKYAGSALDALESAGKTASREVRSVFGAQRLTSAAEAAITAQKGATSAVGRAGSDEVKRIVAALTPAERTAVSDSIDNLRWEGGKATGRLSDKATAIERALEHPDVLSGAADAAKVQKAIADTLGFSKRQWDEGLDRGIFGLRVDGDQAIKPRDEYLQRLYSGETQTQRAKKLLGETPGQMGQASAVKKLKLETPEDVTAYLNAPEQAGVVFERDVAKRLSGRAQQQADLAGKAEIGKSLVPDYVQASPKMREAAHEELRRLASMSPEAAESAKYLKDMLDGLPPRGALTGALAKVNKVIKPMMVYGYAIPKVGSIVRNKVGGLMQALSNPEAAGTVPGQAKRFFSDLYGAVADSIGAADKTAIGRDLKLIDDAYSAAGGVAQNAIDSLTKAGRKDLAGMVKSGVLDGFVSGEQLVSEMARSPGWAKAKSVGEWPGRIFKGVEDRMRAGMYLDLVKQGKSADDAARIVRDSLYDYSVSSAGNRMARDIIPFFQFTAKAIPQQAAFLSRGVAQGSPGAAIAAGMASLTPKGDEDPIYPWMEGRVNVPIGQDMQGNAQYLSGLGLPVEALASIPGPSGSLRELGRDLERTVVGASHPLLKTAYSAVSGRDPFFGTQSGTYGKLPVIGEAGDAGRAINLLRGTGVTQPLESLAGTVNMFTDPRRTPGLAALDYLTGAKVESVDPDRALQQQVTRSLESNPDVEQYRSFYQKSKDPATQQALQLLQEAKARLKEKREAEAERGSVL